METALIGGFYYMDLVELHIKNPQSGDWSTSTKWETVNISSSLDAVAMSFELGVVSKDSLKKDSMIPCTPGDEVEITIGGHKVLSGYVEQTPVSYTADSAVAKIVGRSKTCDLIDCNPIIKTSDYVEASKDTTSWQSSKEKNKTYIAPPTSNLSTIEWKGLKLGQIIAQLIQPYSIRLVVEGSQSLMNKLNEVKNFDASPTDTVLRAIQHLVEKEDLLFYCDENGDLVVGERGYKQTTTPLVLGKNILTADAKFDYSKLFRTYKVTGTKAGSNSSMGVANNTPFGHSTCTSITRTRLNTVAAKGTSSKPDCQKQADNTNNYALAQSNAITYKVQGWYDESNKTLWRVNTLVNVYDPFLETHNTVLISKVTFNLSNDGGTTTTLEVIPPAGVKTLKEQNAGSESQKTTKSSGGTSNNLSWLHK